MKLVFLGSGSAFTVGAGNYQSNVLLVDEHENKLLIDCGSDIRYSLRHQGYSHLDITDIYISHLHGDHVGGLEYIGFTTKFDSRCSQPNLYLAQELVQDLWTHTLSGGMRFIEGDVAELEDYFAVHSISSQNRFTWQDLTFEMVPTVHVNTPVGAVPSYGLFFTIAGTNIFFTTDTQFCPEALSEYFDRADIIFHDCETTPYKSTVHAHYDELRTLPLDIRRKMWLYHYQDGRIPDAIADGFRGFVQCGQVFEWSDCAAAIVPTLEPIPAMR